MSSSVRAEGASKNISLNHNTSVYNTNSNSMTSLSGRTGVIASNNDGANA